MSKKFLSATQIFDAPERTYAEIYIKEWDGYVKLRSMTGKERDAWESSLTVQRGRGREKMDLKNFRARLIAKCAVDENDNALFSNKVEIDKLGDRNVAALQKLFNACQALNGMTDEDVATLVEDFDPAEQADEHSSSDSL